MGNFTQAQARSLTGDSVEGVVQATAGIRVIVYKLQMLQAFLGLGQQYLGIQQKACRASSNDKAVSIIKSPRVG